MANSLSHKIYSATSELPAEWEILAQKNIFLSKPYLEVLEVSAPANMICLYIGLFDQDRLIGIALTQFLDLDQLGSFGDRDQCIKTKIRNFIFKKFSSHVLFFGNNMLTGQNAFVFSNDIPLENSLALLSRAIIDVKKSIEKSGKTIHLTSIKDFNEDEIKYFQRTEYRRNYIFSTQPNMSFEVNVNWNSEVDYIDALTKKYRDQYKRARKKLQGVAKQKMKLEEIIAHENTIYNLYNHVAKNAPFNTFFLSKNHFRVLKEKLKDNFLFYGYFENDKLIGFNTLIKNGRTLDTYFLGYDDTVQKEKMLYLNMLYDMIGYGIAKKFDKIIFGRTALEIKSSIGAKPQKMYGLIEHKNHLINSKMSFIFPFLEPEMTWQERNPFK